MGLTKTQTLYPKQKKRSVKKQNPRNPESIKLLSKRETRQKQNLRVSPVTSIAQRIELYTNPTQLLTQLTADLVFKNVLSTQKKSNKESLKAKDLLRPLKGGR